MTHPLVEQLRFTRSEFKRALRKFPEEDGQKRLGPMNSAGWIVAHMAWHEQRYWLDRLVGEKPAPEVERQATGNKATTPPLGEMLAAWTTITKAADPHLDALDEGRMHESLPGTPPRLIGTALLRVTYHYWFHTGEILAIRQMLDHPRRPEYVGNIDDKAPYRPPDGR